jgi:hypothetical protein
VWAFGFAVWLEEVGRNLIALTGLDVSRSQLLGTPWVQFYDLLIGPSQPWFGIVTYCLMAAILVRNYRVLRSPAERRRIRLMAAGAAAIAVSLLLVGILRRIAGPASPVYVVSEWLQPMLVALGPPLLAYAVLQDRVIGPRVAIRRGVQYLATSLAARLLRGERKRSPEQSPAQRQTD